MYGADASCLRCWWGEIVWGEGGIDKEKESSSVDVGNGEQT